MQELLKAVMALTCRSLRLTMVESEVLKVHKRLSAVKCNERAVDSS
jgi:hypothetical protein